MNARLLALVLSGFAGVGWQLLWVRGATLVLGGTVVAVSVVVGVFLAGLAVGARVGGWRADHHPGSTRRDYAVCELFVAAWGIFTHPVLVGLADRGLGGLVEGPDGWWAPGITARVVQIGFALALVGPPTVAMGAAVPLLGRSVSGPAGDLGRLASALAVANTIGAILAALLVDPAMVPAWGRAATAGVLAATGVGAAMVGGLAPARAPERRDAGPVRTGGARGAPLAAMCVAGFVAMGLEVLQVRFLGSALGPYRAVFGLVLATSLGGWALGAAAAGRVPNRIAGPLLALAQPAVGLLALAGFLLHDPERLLRRQLADPSWSGQLSTALLTLLPAVLPAAIAMGAVLPLAARRALGPVGANLGALWSAQALGNTLGALVAGLVLLPALGLQGSTLLLVALSFFGGAIADRAARSFPLLLTGAIVVPLVLTQVLPADRLLWATFPAGRVREEGVRAVVEGVEQTLVVTGDAEGASRLWTNGHPMSSSSLHAQRYMRLMAHLPLLAQAAPKRALVICFGVGNTLHAASLHPLDSLWIADTSREILRASSLFQNSNRDVLADPRLHVRIDDGRHVLAGLPAASLDLVTLEPPPIAHAAVASLYTEEFYRAARSRLAPGGWITQWLPAYQVPAPVVSALVATFLDVFPGGVLLVGDGRELFLAGVKDGVPTLGPDVEGHLAARPEVAADLAALELDARSLALTFGASSDTLLRATRGAERVTDDRPLLEAAAVSHVMDTRLPDGLLDPTDFATFAPTFAENPIVRAAIAANRDRWTAEAFVHFTNLP